MHHKDLTETGVEANTGPAVPLDEALAPYVAAARENRRLRLHQRLAAEHTVMLAAIDGQLAASYSGDEAEVAEQTRRLVRAQLVASDVCADATAYYPAGSEMAVALTMAMDALSWAAWRNPELVGQVQAELRAVKAVR